MGRQDKITVRTIVNMKAVGEKVVMLTAYDYQTAVLEDRAGVGQGPLGHPRDEFQGQLAAPAREQEIRGFHGMLDE